MGIFNTIDVSASGLTAQRLRLDTIASNLANSSTTRTTKIGPDGKPLPYRRQMVVFEAMPGEKRDFSNVLKDEISAAKIGNGVRVKAVVEDLQTPLRRVYDPTHPDADNEGYVNYPNVNPVTEMVDMIDTTRSYEANAQAINAVKSMVAKALELAR
ncbi:MAG: flagellar basal body rod protein FlgC [Methylocystaceae bacterium]